VCGAGCTLSIQGHNTFDPIARGLSVTYAMNSANELITLIGALRTLHCEPTPQAALATLIRTRGSTFRRPGTRMLVLNDGRVVCELSGGCPQRDIVARALDAMRSSEPRIVSYNAGSGLDVLMEMGCGGELEVFIEPLRGNGDTDFGEVLAKCLDDRVQANMATVFAIDDSAVIPTRQIWGGGNILYRSIVDHQLSSAIIDPPLKMPLPRATTLRLASSRGTADVLMETITPPHALVVIGGGSVAHGLLMLAQSLGWHTTLVEQDPQRAHQNRSIGRLNRVYAPPGQLRKVLRLDSHSSVVVMTHNFEQDMAYLRELTGVPLTYIGALGSRERVVRMRNDSSLRRLEIHAPAGLDIGSETPAEIAVAIAAEIMAVINQREAHPLRDRDGKIH
jgi:xanthine dehydrogenase accessory factor